MIGHMRKFVMDNGASMPNTALGTLADNTMNFDLMDELLYDSGWLETGDGSSFFQPALSISSPWSFSSHYPPFLETDMSHLNQEETIRSNTDLIYPLLEELEHDGSHRDNWEVTPLPASSNQFESFLVEGTEIGRRLWIGPGGNSSPAHSMKKRLLQAFEYLKESTRDRDILIQVWVPINSGGRCVLTTNNQPFSLNTNCKDLADYRDISRSYEFAAEEDSSELVGLPGRVFLKKLPEWTPDVRFFRSEEYPRINFAHQYSVSGSLAVPIFERGSGTCLGVVEIVTTTRKVNYRPELENVCKALEAVDLRSSVLLSPPQVKDCNESYQAALAEIQEVLKFVCDTLKLPLAQTWAPCRQGKAGCRLPDGDHASCISICSSACYVRDDKVLGFHEACLEHHLIRGEGVSGGALMTNKLCFATDIKAFSKTEYPLSHHAMMFELCAAAAIRLRSVNTGSANFILEFFLPLDCQHADEQSQILSSLSSVIQQVSWSLRVVTDQELAVETPFPERETVNPSNRRPDEDDTPKLLSPPSIEATQDESSWITHMMEAQRGEDKGVDVSLGCHKEEPEEFNEIDLHEQNLQEFGTKGREESGGDFSSVGRHCPPGARKSGEKRGTKTERTVSLQVLRQYFSGSLKDAAKSIGVCPTTLKRICRQNGITRWPSRKIKKVGHSLRKLQRVIDSVQGAEGTLQLGSFYTNFPELSSPNVSATGPFSTSNANDHLKHLKTQPEGSLLSLVTTASKSPSSSCSHSSNSSLCCSTGAKQLSISANTSGIGDTLSGEPTGWVLKRESSDAELLDLVQKEENSLVGSHSHNIFSKHHPSLEDLPPLTKSSGHGFHALGAFRVKATFEEEKIRFSMPSNWGFRDLQGEIFRRFSVDDISQMDLKYMDDDAEWVLLTCEADLEECIDIHKSSQSRTIKLCLHQKIRLNVGSLFGSSATS